MLPLACACRGEQQKPAAGAALPVASRGNLVLCIDQAKCAVDWVAFPT